MNTPFRMAATAALALLATACAHRERMGGGADQRSDAAVYEYWQMDPCARGEPELPIEGPGLGRVAGTGWMGLSGPMGGGMRGERGMGGGMGGGMAGGWMRCLEGLDLSPEQRASVDQIREQAQGEHWKLMQEMHARGRPGMGDAPGAGSDEDRRRAYDEAAALRKRMFESRLATRTRLLEVLTPAQRERLGRECNGPWGPGGR